MTSLNQHTKITSLTARLHLQSSAEHSHLNVLMEPTGEYLIKFCKMTHYYRYL